MGARYVDYDGTARGGVGPLALIRVPNIRSGNGLPSVSKEAFAVFAGVAVRLDVEG